MVRGPREAVVAEVADEEPGHHRGSGVRLAVEDRDDQEETHDRLHDREDLGHRRHPLSRSRRLGWSWAYAQTLSQAWRQQG